MSAEQTCFERNTGNIDGQANGWLCYHFTYFHGTHCLVPDVIFALRPLKAALCKLLGALRLAPFCRVLGDPAYRSERRLMRARPEHLIRFTDFERIVNGLCHCLKPGGLLVILGSNFRFADAATAKFFEVVYRIDQALQRVDTPLFGRDNFKLEKGLYNDAMFRKKERL